MVRPHTWHAVAGAGNPYLSRHARIVHWSEPQRLLQSAWQSDNRSAKTVFGVATTLRKKARLQQCDNLLVLDRKLAAFLDSGKTPPEIAEQLALADLCMRYKHYHAAAARLQLRYAEVAHALLA